MRGWDRLKKASDLEEPSSGTFSKYPDSGRFKTVL